jgi:tetratricopeptide (TPR) repeat protein
MLTEASAHHRAGRLLAAKALYGKILDHDAGNPDALHLLGVIAFQEGRYNLSASLINRAIEEDPEQASFYSNLGNTFNAMGKWPKALACYKKALAIAPEMADALFNLGNAYQKQSKIDKAIEHYQRAVKANPNCALIYNNLGIAYNEKGMTGAAISAYSKAIQIDPKFIDAYNNLCALQEGFNQLTAASKTALDAISIAPHSSFAKLNLAQICYRQHRYNEALQLLKTIRTKDLPGDLYSRTYHLLGKINNRLDRCDAAFESFSMANQRVLESDDIAIYREKSPDTFQEIEQTGKFFTPERVRTWRCIQKATEQMTPSFLVGFPRSGTTLLEQILNAHNQVATLDEQPVFEDIFKQYRHPGVNLERLDHLPEEEIALHRSKYFQMATDRIEKHGSIRIIVDKLPLNILYLGVIYRFFPDAKIIVALRHPMGCMLSNFMQQFRMNKMMFNFLTIEGTARFYATVMQLYLHYRHVLPLHIHQVRYEDIVENLESEARDLLGFLGLEWQQGVLNYYNAAKDQKIRTPSYSQAIRPIYREAVSRWKKYLHHLGPTIPWVRPFIKEFGYS